MSNNIPSIRVSQQDSDNLSVSMSSKKNKAASVANDSQAAAAGENEPKKAKLTPEIEAQLKEAFAVFDVSGDGQIDAGELQTILIAVNKNREVTLEEVEEMIQAVDEGGDGEIQLPEFLQLMADQMMA